MLRGWGHSRHATVPAQKSPGNPCRRRRTVLLCTDSPGEVLKLAEAQTLGLKLRCILATCQIESEIQKTAILVVFSCPYSTLVALALGVHCSRPCSPQTSALPSLALRSGGARVGPRHGCAWIQASLIFPSAWTTSSRAHLQKFGVSLSRGRGATFERRAWGAAAVVVAPTIDRSRGAFDSAMLRRQCLPDLGNQLRRVSEAGIAY